MDWAVGNNLRFNTSLLGVITEGKNFAHNGVEVNLTFIIAQESLNEQDNIPPIFLLIIRTFTQLSPNLQNHNNHYLFQVILYDCLQHVLYNKD